MGEEDITDEVLRGLDPGVRSTLEQAIGRAREKAAMGSEARDILRELRDTSGRIEHAISGLGERMARVETAQQDQRDRTALFWSRDWPGLERRIDRAESDLEAMGLEMRDEFRRMRDHPSPLTEAMAGACRMTIELAKLLIDRPKTLGVLAVFALICLGLGIVAGGGLLTATWGDLSLSVRAHENADRTDEPGPVLAPMGD
jgi:hypothetical protein